MVYLEMSVSGPQLARKLLEDAEEAAYGFGEMLDYEATAVGSDMAQYMSGEQCKEVSQWLLNLSAEISGHAT